MRLLVAQTRPRPTRPPLAQSAYRYNRRFSAASSRKHGRLPVRKDAGWQHTAPAGAHCESSQAISSGRWHSMLWSHLGCCAPVHSARRPSAPYGARPLLGRRPLPTLIPCPFPLPIRPSGVRTCYIRARAHRNAPGIIHRPAASTRAAHAKRAAGGFSPPRRPPARGRRGGRCRPAPCTSARRSRRGARSRVRSA